MKDRFAPNTVETTNLYNDKARKRAYYAFPIKQQTLHVQYWKDMLGQAGFKENDIPGTWKEYWSFWCDKVQPGFRKATGKRLFGVGIPMGVKSTDSFRSFLSWVDAYNVKLVDDSGQAAGRRSQGERRAWSRPSTTTPTSTSRAARRRRRRLEGSRQQRRLPQPRRRDDAQLHHLDRRQVARRRQQRER